MHKLALGGCLAAFFFVVSFSSESNAQSNTTAPAQQTQNQQATTQAPVVPDQTQTQTDAGYYEASCDKPKQREDADYCQQRRMAQAAEDAVWWASFQTKLGIAGFIAVLLSLIFTGWAAYAASSAAKAAQASVKVASETAEKQLRAYIFIDGGLFELTPAQNKIKGSLVLRNFGQTPGSEFEVYARVGIFDAGKPIFDMTKLHPEKSAKTVIGPSARNNIDRIVKVNGTELAAIRAGFKSVFMWGVATYVDAFGKHHEFVFHCLNVAHQRTRSEMGMEPYHSGEKTK